MSAIKACIDYARKNQLGKPQDKQSAATQAAAELEALRAVVEAARKYTELKLSDENCPNCLRRISDGHDDGCELEALAAALERVQKTEER